jgi:hypothetical protein
MCMDSQFLKDCSDGCLSLRPSHIYVNIVARIHALM